MTTLQYAYGDDGSGASDEFEAPDRDAAVEYVREELEGDARRQAADESSTVRLSYHLYGKDEDGEWERLGTYEFEAQPEVPECSAEGGHVWRNPDPEWAGRCLTAGSPTVTYVRVCDHCKVERTEMSPVMLPDHTVTSTVSYRFPSDD